MTEEQVCEWILYHAKSLSSFGSWLSSQDFDHIASLWQRPLTQVSLADAKEVTQRMVAGDIERPFPDETASYVRTEAMKIWDQRRFREQQEIRTMRGIECGLCGQTGMVTIWHPLLVRAMIQGVDTFIHPRTRKMFCVRTHDGRMRSDTVVAACRCSAGDRFANQSRMRHGIVIEPMRRFGESQYDAVVGCHESHLSTEERLAIDVERWSTFVIAQRELTGFEV